MISYNLCLLKKQLEEVILKSKSCVKYLSNSCNTMPLQVINLKVLAPKYWVESTSLALAHKMAPKCWVESTALAHKTSYWSIILNQMLILDRLFHLPLEENQLFKRIRSSLFWSTNRLIRIPWLKWLAWIKCQCNSQDQVQSNSLIQKNWKLLKKT